MPGGRAEPLEASSGPHGLALRGGVSVFLSCVQAAVLACHPK